MYKVYHVSGVDLWSAWNSILWICFQVHHILINLDIRSVTDVQEDMSDSDGDSECRLFCCPDLFSCHQKNQKAPSDVDQRKNASLKKKGLRSFRSNARPESV